jgi:hypothetical protein
VRSARLVQVAVSLVGLAVLGGCSALSPTPSSSSATPRYGIEPTGAPVTIEPLQAIDGAQRYEFEGLGIDVPAGSKATSATLNDGSIQVQIRVDGAERATTLVTVTDQVGSGTTVVNATAGLGAAQLAMSGVASNIVSSPAAWDGMGYAVAVTTDMNVSTNAGPAALDGFIVFVADPSGTHIVGVSAEAPAGQLAQSQAYAALRTVRFDG